MISAFCQLILRDFSRTFPAAFPELAFPKLFLMELFLRFSPDFAENKFFLKKDSARVLSRFLQSPFCILRCTFKGYTFCTDGACTHS